jgi:hypothetical protein
MPSVHFQLYRHHLLDNLFIQAIGKRETDENPCYSAAPVPESYLGSLDGIFPENKYLPATITNPVCAFDEGHIVLHDQVIANFTIHYFFPVILSPCRAPIIFHELYYPTVQASATDSM